MLGLTGLLAGSANAQLLHRYNFYSGTANDTVGTANGTLEGAATISGGSLNVNGTAGYWNGSAPQNGVMLPSTAVAGITNGFAIEMWFIANNVSGGFSTLFSFSDDTHNNYVLATPARGNSPYPSGVAIIGGGGNTSEQQAGGIYLDNGSGPHDMVINFDGTNVTYYLDGALAPDDPISHVSPTFTDVGLNLSTLPDIGIGGGSPWPDNSMKGNVFDFRIYGQSLTAAQVASIDGLGTNASNASIAAALLPPSSFVWDGAGANNNWSTGGNWIGGTAPALSGNSVTFAGSTGTSPNLDANFSVTGLTFSNTASAFTIGTTSSTLTLAGDVVNNSSSTETFNVPLSFNVSAALNAASGGLIVNSNINIGSAALTLTGNNNFTLNGNVSGSGIFTMNGAGTLALGGNTLTAGTVSFNNGTTTLNGLVNGGAGTTYIGYTSGNAVVNMSGGAFNTVGEVRVGGSDINGTAPNGTGIFNITSGRANLGTLTLARGNNYQNTVSGTVNLSPGTSMVSTNDVILGFAGAGLGKLVINGATFTIGPAATKWFMVGFYDTTSGELDITNGNLLLENGSSIKMCRGGTAGANVVNQAGGNVTFYSDSGVTLGGGGNLDMSFAGAALSSDTYNLIGGTLTVPQIVASSASGVSAFNFQGGTLKPTASSTAFMQGLSGAYVYSGSAKVDTTNFNITIGQTLQDGDGLGGGLTKIGSGTLTLGGGYSYSGPTVVQGGILVIDPTLTTSANGLTISNAAVNLSLNNGMATLYAGAVTLAGNSALNLNFGTATAPTSAAVNASGVSISGTNTINITGPYLVAGQYPLIYTGGSVPTNHFTLGPLPTGVVAVLTNSGASLDLLVTASGQTLTWYGADNLGDPLTTWNINTSSNWNGGLAKYQQYSGNSYGDNVFFDDTLYSPADASINLNTTVVPSSVTFNNSSTPYSITGTGGIAGPGMVVMNGPGTTYFGTTNGYTGGTVIKGGTLSVASDQALGAVAVPVTLSGGTLQYSNAVTTTRSFTVVSNSTIDLPAGGQLSGAISGTGALTKTGAGILTLSGADSAPTVIGTGPANLVGAVTNLSMTVGGVAGDAVMSISGALVSSNLFIGNVSGSSAAVTQTGGSLYLNGGTGDNLSIGNWAGSFGYFNAAGGTININGINIGGEENPNVWPPTGSGDGIMEVRGATINNSGWIVLARGGGPNTGILNMYSGSLTYSGGGIGINWELTANNDQTSIINLMGGSITSTNQGLYFRTTDTGIVNLNGGVLQGTAVSGPGVVNFNGGTLRPCSGFAVPFLSVNAVDVFSGGASIDDNGLSFTITQPLLAPTGDGVSSITLSDGGSGYIAPPIVLISGGTGSNATAIAQINFATGVITNILVTCPGTGYSSGDTLTVTFSDGGSSAVAPASATANLTANTSGGLTKLGSGSVTLDGANTYTGTTTVSAGTLAGTGTVAGALVNNATLSPGDSGSGSLTVNGNITLNAGSTNIFSVNGTAPANSSITAGGAVTYGGVLKIAASGTFTADQQFQLFSGAGVASTSNFSSIQSSASGVTFGFTNGVLTVLSVSTVNANPPQMQVSISGNLLRLAWPTNAGWILQSNSVGLTSSGSWFNYPADGSAGVTNVSITINPAKPNVFYRMVKP